MAIKYGRPIEQKLRFGPVEAERPVEDRRPLDLELTTRPRRNRRAEWVRRLVREHVLALRPTIPCSAWWTGSRSTPGIDSTGTRRPAPSTRKSGQIRSPVTS